MEAKLCPLNKFKPCKEIQCAFYINECAIRSMGFIDFTLQGNLNGEIETIGEEE